MTDNEAKEQVKNAIIEIVGKLTECENICTAQGWTFPASEIANAKGAIDRIGGQLCFRMFRERGSSRN